MIWDVLTFSCLIIIFLLGYGIASQALLFPSVPFDRQTVLGSFYRFAACVNVYLAVCSVFCLCVDSG